MLRGHLLLVKRFLLESSSEFRDYPVTFHIETAGFKVNEIGHGIGLGSSRCGKCGMIAA